MCVKWKLSFQMVGPTRSTLNGFGALGSGDLPPSPPTTLTEAFVVTQTEVLCQILQAHRLWPNKYNRCNRCNRSLDLSSFAHPEYLPRLIWIPLSVQFRCWKWNEPVFHGRKPDSLHIGGSPRRATTCNPMSQQYQKSIQEDKNRYSTTFIYYINQSTFLRHMPSTSPTGLNQTGIKRLAEAPCKCGKLHIRRQLERRKSSNHPIRRCRSRSPALCQRHHYLPDERVGHVSFPTKRQKWCIIYYAGYSPTLAVEGLSKAAKQHSM
jgi:hypothetical protein